MIQESIRSIVDGDRENAKVVRVADTVRETFAHPLCHECSRLGDDSTKQCKEPGQIEVEINLKHSITKITIYMHDLKYAGIPRK